MEKEKKIKLKKLRSKLGTAAIIMMLNGCAATPVNTNTVDSTNSTTVESTSEITEEELTTEIPTTEEVTEEPTTEYQIETIEYDCPIEYNGEMLADVQEYIDNNYIDHFYDTGYDSPILRQILIDYVEEKTGIRDDSITIDNFKFFQFGGKESTHFDRGLTMNTISEHAEKGMSPEDLYITRAALIENDLRYIIDEIPYSYFEEKFPDIMDNYSSLEYRDSLFERYFELIDTYQLDSNLFELSDLSETDSELIKFFALRGYNDSRTSYIYKYTIPQVRDINTNKIQLNPVKSQIDEMNKGVSKIPGFIDNVMKVETRENYYECYGVYPEDVIDETNSMTKSK